MTRNTAWVATPVACDALLDLSHPTLHLGRREVPVPIVDRLELTAVNGHKRIGKEIEPPAERDELSGDLAGLSGRFQGN